MGSGIGTPLRWAAFCRLFLTIIISMEAREVRSSWASLGMLTRGVASSREDGPDTGVGGQTPEVAVVSAPVHPEGQLIQQHLWAWGLLWVVRRACGSLPGLLGCGILTQECGFFWQGHCQWPRVVRLSWCHHLWGACGAPCHLLRSHITLHSIPEGAPYFSMQHCRTLASTKVSYLQVSLESLILRKSRCGRKSHQPRLWTLHGASHQPPTSSWTVGSLNAMACFLVICCTMASVSPPMISFIEWPKFLPPDRGLPVLGHVHMDPLPRVLFGVWCISAYGPGSTGTHKLAWWSITSLWLGSSHKVGMMLVTTIAG